MKLVDLTPVALSVIAVLAAIITFRVIPILKEKLSSSQIESIFSWVKIGVKAAEQLCKDGRLDPEGRKDYVTKYVTNLLEENGFTIDFDQIDKMIEAVVSELPKTFNDTPKVEEVTE